MDIFIINASPKGAENNSAYFLHEIKTLLDSRYNVSEIRIKKPGLSKEVIQSVSSWDTLIIAFPLYVDSLPSHLTNVLTELNSALSNMELQQVNHKPIKVFGVVNCGFYEGKQTHIALQILENWCKKTGFEWCQGIGIGAGEMFGQLNKIPLGHGPKKSLGRALKTLVKNITEGKKDDNIYVSPNFPRGLFKLMADIHWNGIAKSLGIKKKELRKNTI